MGVGSSIGWFSYGYTRRWDVPLGLSQHVMYHVPLPPTVPPTELRLRFTDASLQGKPTVLFSLLRGRQTAPSNVIASSEMGVVSIGAVGPRCADCLRGTGVGETDRQLCYGSEQAHPAHGLVAIVVVRASPRVKLSPPLMPNGR